MIEFEVAKNGEYTCRTVENDKKKYLYSKYNPSNSLFLEQPQLHKEYFIVLGVGLGYEVEHLLNCSTQHIYLVETNDEFKNRWRFSASQSERLTVLEDVLQIRQLIEGAKGQTFINEKICMLDLNYYKHIIEQQPQQKKTIVCIDYPLFMDRIVKVLEEMNYEVIVIEEENFLKLGNINKPEFVMSLNFSPYICSNAMEADLKYVSWVIDVPNYLLYLKQEYMDYKNLWVFHFDEGYLNDLKKLVQCHLEYLPLAADEKLLSEIDNMQYTCDVSFVGSLLSFNEYTQIVKAKLPTELEKEVNKLINIQLKNTEFILDKEVTVDLIAKLENIIGQWQAESYELIDRKMVWGILLTRYVSYLQRGTLMKALAVGSFEFHLYGDSEWNSLNNEAIDNVLKGKVPYYPTSYEVFKASKININDTRPYFKNAIPLRIYDILSIGGFIITNEHPSLKGVFEDGVDLVVYRDHQHLLELIEYYLEHEDERLKIAKQGYETLKKYHSLKARIQHIINKVCN